MFGRIQSYFFDRAANSKRVHPIYILPTLDGLKVLGLNLVLLVMGLVYANNYVLLFNFMLFCLFLGSMYYTHFNLSGLTLESIHFPEVHVGETGLLYLTFKTKNSQGNYFIRPYFKSSILKIDNESLSFPVNFKHTAPMEIPVSGKLRGRDIIHSIYIESLFPFNFFRCFTFFRVDQVYFVYPEREKLKEHTEVEITENERGDGEEFFLRDYRIGDSLKRIDWKKLAQTNRWYSRQFQVENPNPIMLVLNDVNREASLRSICYALHSLHQQDVKYGLNLENKVMISPKNSPNHLSRCLQELASYEA